MNPINYDQIIKKAEARRAALEEMSALMPTIYTHWETLCRALHGLHAINQKYLSLDDEGKMLLATSVGMRQGPMSMALYNLSAMAGSTPGGDTRDLLELLRPKEEDEDQE